MTTIEGMTSRSLDVPGARLHYEVRGEGPLVLVIGSPMPAADFAPLAHALAGDHTVVTYDPRGLSHSTIDDPRQDATPELRADDVAALIDALGADRADVFGSSGGAVTGLALVTRHPGRSAPWSHTSRRRWNCCPIPNGSAPPPRTSSRRSTGRVRRPRG